MASLLDWTSPPWLRATRQPTPIVSGDDDPVTPPINHWIMAALIPNAQFRTVKGGGHLMLIDSPVRVAPVIATSSTVASHDGCPNGTWWQPGS
jgi:pimeloyl-ACP methyl ester carboxylesterase